jgi:membrane protein DedA with SNARE-associated domain
MNSLLIIEFSEIISWVISSVTWIISTLGYPGLGLAMFLENVIPSIPSEVVLPFAGSLIAEGKFSLVGITIVGMLGSVLGAWVYYGLGYWMEESRVRALIRKYGKYALLSEKDFDRAINWFQKAGDLVVFFGRIIPMVRSLISIPAGMARISPLRFTLFTALGTGLWSFLLAYIGLILGENWERIGQILSQYKSVVLVLVGVGVVWFFGRRILKLRKKQL